MELLDTSECPDIQRNVKAFDALSRTEQAKTWHHVAECNDCYNLLTDKEKTMIVVQALFDSGVV